MNTFITPQAHPWSLPTSIAQSWCAFNTASYSDSLYPALGVPFPDSLNRAVPKRRAEFLAGRYCARDALSLLGEQKEGGKKSGHHPESPGIGPQGSPLWPGGVKGSISHSRAWACALASADPEIAGLGVDIENIVDNDTLEQSVDLILVEEERPLLDLSGLDARSTFTLLFSLKESFFKAAYPTVGHYFDFDAVTVSHVDVQAQVVAFRLNVGLHDNLLKDAYFQAYYQYLDEHTLATLVFLSAPSSAPAP